MIYLDNAATTKVCDEAKAAVMEGLEAFGNPSSLHHLGVVSEEILNNARKTLAGSLGVKDKEIFFTSCATESSNTVIFGAAKACGKRRKKIITTTIEHPSVAAPINELEEQGFEVVRVSPDENGRITPESIISLVDKNTLLVSVMYVNNETGYILPVKEIFKGVKRANPDTVCHCDCVQSFMKLPFKAKDIGADCISLSGHKLHAPKGVGALYVKSGVRILPLMLGGGQESGFRSGTENVALINSFAAAVKKLEPTVMQRYETVLSLKKRLIAALSGKEGIAVNSGDDCSPYVISVSVERIKSETMLHFLESRDIYVSSGSACSKGKKSSVLKELKIPEKYLDSTIRVSLCAENTEGDIDAFVSALLEGQASLAKIR
ncbi:MAG: cysteine desulfurase [Ruminococcus sp.]|nr:cysteine desulfurase [Ruminococcus sp.]